jgi:hypothetical protein
MATKELRELRSKYRTAYTAYMKGVQALSDASQKGEFPTNNVLRKEAEALNDLTFARQRLLDALLAHSRTGPSSL